MNPLFEGLNSAQLQAVEQSDGPVLVIAGAGAGKTKVLTHRIAYLLQQGVPSWRILALTFTNKAAREMKERIEKLVGSDHARDLWMGTFHSIFGKILRVEAQYVGFDANYTIYDTSDSKSLIGKIIGEMNLDKDSYKQNAILSRISNAKNSLITPAAYLQNTDFYKHDLMQKVPQAGEIYQRYVARCRQANAMDFDDLLLYTNILFRDNPEILAKYQERFHYILVDEFQDTNVSQNLIVKKLALPHNNICVVGDDAQSIYAFRGAKIENILNFSADYPNYKIFKLEQNYRSTPTIVDAANSVIAKNRNQIPKKTFSEQIDGEKIKVFAADTDIEEGVMVSKEIKKLADSGVNYSDIAILYRTNAQSRIMEEMLNKQQIPCRVYGGTSFFQRKEVRDMLAYVRVAVNPKDSEALMRCIAYPSKGIGATSVEKMTMLAERNTISLWDVFLNIEKAYDVFNKGTIAKIAQFRELLLSFSADLQTADAYSLMNRMFKQTGIEQDLKADDSIEGVNRLDNVMELLNGVKDFVEADENAETPYLPNYLEKVALFTDMDTDNDDARNKVTLMTIHSAKGLEFTYCFIVGLEENLFPSNMFGAQSPSNVEEERRLFYVALTRAKQAAYFSYANSRRIHGNITAAAPSRFLQEVNPEFLEQEIRSGFSGFSGFQRGGGFNSAFGNRSGNTSYSKPQFTGFKKPPTAAKPVLPVDFSPSNPADVRAGHTVEHQTFGRGLVQDVQDSGRLAVIEFQAVGEKRMLLKFAKLRIVD
ncbi:MAG: ATP-dependent helicase [Bacteroidales bacterium]|jgi:DNA helicase-2/ATP-dependent DNA helicase PcrA|nr:ATP-dependent helicase [Bacteroidales bacterium]